MAQCRAHILPAASGPSAARRQPQTQRQPDEGRPPPSRQGFYRPVGRNSTAVCATISRRRNSKKPATPLRVGEPSLEHGVTCSFSRPHAVSAARIVRIEASRTISPADLFTLRYVVPAISAQGADFLIRNTWSRIRHFGKDIDSPMALYEPARANPAEKRPPV